ncbi:uncharacterized protein LOC118198973 [Stegodyphus dumicola]|uniref:uncharacterized protein LOC118198973 n=1 Tax=Stegodyphus dumicola TaxID=202533 RepID=UPI0015B068D7|nr:uncharacterized protein LOC118198973 [Stegodyphus dumicola]
MMEGHYHGQHWTAWFLWKEGIQGSEIHCCMVPFCGNKALSRHTVSRWLAKFSSGMETTAKGVSEGRPAASHTAANVAAVSDLIMAKRRITSNKMQEETGLAQRTLQAIVLDDLEMTNVCAKWVDLGPRTKTSD